MAEKYYELLQKANMSELKDPQQFYALLKEALAILKNPQNQISIELTHIPILERRLLFYDDRESYVKAAAQKLSLLLAPPVKSSMFANFPAADTLELDDLLAAEANSMIETENSSAVGIPSTEIEALAAIINTIYDSLRQRKPLTYQDYFQFYEEVNALISVPLPKFVRETNACVYFVGDTHGSYNESIILVNFFEQLLASNPAIKIVFLGDYVDRNPQDLENFSLLLGFFLHHKQNVVLLRGNHEDEAINKAYGFYQNLSLQFDDPDKVADLYYQILSVFTHLSIVFLNTLDNSSGIGPLRIFATHGGIPVNHKESKIPVILDEIETSLKQTATTFKEFDEYLNWLLWADPNEQITDMVYDPTSGRSQYGTKVFADFLEANNFDLVVRAHEKLSEGYKFVFNKKLISLFSTSFYNGQRIGEGKIMRLECGKEPEFLPINEEILQKTLE